jgi:putative YphP/YqiW family bacilliredoxin
MMYDERFIAPMRQELTGLGIEELRTAAEVDAKLQDSQETTLLVVNSMCGCAARNARPAVASALQHSVRPSRLFTVFSGQDADATRQARSYITGYAPSSPSIAMFKGGKLVYMIERHEIEGRTADAISADMTAAFDKYCAKETAAA